MFAHGGSREHVAKQHAGPNHVPLPFTAHPSAIDDFAATETLPLSWQLQSAARAEWEGLQKDIRQYKGIVTRGFPSPRTHDETRHFQTRASKAAPVSMHKKQVERSCDSGVREAGHIAQECEMAVNQTLGATERCRPPGGFNNTFHDTADGLLCYVVQVMLSVRRCLLERMSVLLGPRSPQLPFLARLIDDQLRVLQSRCKGYATTLNCFQAWRSTRVQRLADHHATKLQESHRKISQVQIETRALTIRLVEVMQERDAETAVYLKHRYLVKWHQFAMAKRMVCVAEAHLRTSKEQRDYERSMHGQLCAEVLHQCLQRHLVAVVHFIFHLWASALMTQRLANACEHWRTDTATLHMECQRLRASQEDWHVRAVGVECKLHCRLSMQQALYFWKASSMIFKKDVTRIAQRAMTTISANSTQARKLQLFKAWSSEVYVARDAQTKSLVRQLQDADLHRFQVLRASVLHSNFRKLAWKAASAVFTMWKDWCDAQACEKARVQDKRRLCLEHESLHQSVVLAWCRGNCAALKQVYFIAWEGVVGAQAQARLAEANLTEVESLLRKSISFRCHNVLRTCQEVFSSRTTQVCFRSWLVVLSTSRREDCLSQQLEQAKVAEQQLTTTCFQEQQACQARLKQISMAWALHDLAFRKRLWLGMWMSACILSQRENQDHLRCQRAEAAQCAQSCSFQEKEEEQRLSFCRFAAHHDHVLDCMSLRINQERLRMLLQLSLVGWTEVLNARALRAERRKAHEARCNLSLAFDAEFYRIFLAWDRGRIIHMKRMCLGGWLAIAQVMRSELDAEEHTEAAARMVADTCRHEAEYRLRCAECSWSECALGACGFGLTRCLRRLCFRGWLATIACERRRKLLSEMLIRAEHGEKQASSILVARQRRMAAVMVQKSDDFLKYACLRTWAAAHISSIQESQRHDEHFQATASFKRLCLHAWCSVLNTKHVEAQWRHCEKQRILEAETRSAQAFQVRLEAVRNADREHHLHAQVKLAAQLSRVTVLWQRSEIHLWLHACFAGWNACLLHAVQLSELQMETGQMRSAHGAACDRMVLFLEREQLAHLRSTCLLAWAEITQGFKSKKAMKLEEENRHMCGNYKSRFHWALDASERASVLSLKRAALAGWLDVMSAEIHVKTELRDLGTSYSVRYNRALQAWDCSMSANAKRFALQLWWLAIAICAEQKLEAQRRAQEDELVRTQLHASCRRTMQFERIVTMWEKCHELAVRRACLVAWLAMLRAAAQNRVEEQRLAEAEQCVAVMQTARYDWDLHAWERGLSVSLKRVCLRGWATVVDSQRKDSKDSVAQPAVPQHSAAAVHALLARGRRGASMLRQLHGILATAAEESGTIAEQRAISLAAGEVALRSAALPRHSPAWTEAARARVELDQLERLTRHLGKGVIPALSYIEAAHGELLVALKLFADTWGNDTLCESHSDLILLDQPFDLRLRPQSVNILRSPEERTAMNVSNQVFGALDDSQQMSISSETPTLDTPRLVSTLCSNRPAAALGLPMAFSPETSASPQELSSSKKSGVLDGVVCSLRDFVEERRRSSRMRGSPPRQNHAAGHITSTRQRPALEA